MTEFETMTLAYQWVSLWVAAGVGALQTGLIGYGIYRMGRAADQRTAHEDARAAREDARAAREDARHAEAMRALEALIERTRP